MLDSRMLLKKVSDGQRVLVMCGHAQPIGRPSPSQQPRLKRMQHWPVNTHILPCLVDQCFCPQDHPCCHIGMSIEVLGSTMYHEVIAKGQGTLVVGGGKGVISNSQGTSGMSNLGCSPQIRQVHCWVRWRFSVHNFCVRAHRLSKGRRMSLVNSGNFDTIAGERICKQR